MYIHPPKKCKHTKKVCFFPPIWGEEALADNMNKLIENPGFAAQLRDNASQINRERFSNWMEIQKWVKCYKLCIENNKNGTPIPDKCI